jgi:hypothetical protein
VLWCGVLNQRAFPALERRGLAGAQPRIAGDFPVKGG